MFFLCSQSHKDCSEGRLSRLDHTARLRGRGTTHELITTRGYRLCEQEQFLYWSVSWERLRRRGRASFERRASGKGFSPAVSTTERPIPRQVGKERNKWDSPPNI